MHCKKYEIKRSGPKALILLLTKNDHTLNNDVDEQKE